VTISEIKKKHPRVRFYELSDKPQQKGFCLKNEEDFFSFVSKVGYYEEEYDADELASRAIEEFCRDISFEYRHDFAKYADEYVHTDISVIIEKTHGRSGLSDIYLYGLDSDVSFKYSSIEALTLTPVTKELNDLFEDFKVEEDIREKARDEEIKQCIMKYKEPYMNATSKKQKTEIITQLQCELKINFGLDGRSCYQYSKAGLMFKLDRYCPIESPPGSDS